jgi:hypothetical protein
VSFTVAEKLAGKDKVAPFVEKPRGEPTLVPSSDKRPPMAPVFDAIDVDVLKMLG